jgi:hypothetical protein
LSKAASKSGNETAALAQPVSQTLTGPQLQAVAQQALADWQSADATAGQSAQLGQVPVSLQALPASYFSATGGATTDGGGSTTDSNGALDSPLPGWPQATAQPDDFFAALSNVMMSSDTSETITQNLK